ncbi:uncharacterized protein LOC132696926 [Cylas formicarius]|uniref:uncharacterized protein LOC132696926 n=1 Tax=Cylas formicarius TaxID=197179 RepID=UPI002958986D|nr:uncharacterized protein LOC132696926 [Cylas formicarius]
MSLNQIGLVAYDNSSSENETDDESIGSENIIKEKTVDQDSVNCSGDMAPNEFFHNSINKTSPTLESDITTKIAHLPECRNFSTPNLELNDKLEEFIPTIKSMKDKNKVKIMIPSLSEFKDVGEEEPGRKRIKPSEKDEEMWEKICGKSKTQTKRDHTSIHRPDVPEPVIKIAPEPNNPLDALDNKAFKELVGKTKRPMGNIKLIDINEEEILPDKELWMTKSLTDPEMSPKAQVGDAVDPTKRRKHHITYLAQQAKANEQELKSAWAAGKNNRIMSRAKYGF